MISFLTTRVSEPDEHDWKRLKRVLSFLECTKDEVRIIGCDGLVDLFTWIDAAYAVHHNMRSHTGGIISLGWGSLHAESSKQKLNTKSSTKGEVVGMSKYITYNIWLLNFLKSDGYEVQHNVIYQDNQSAIQMEKNGRNSCTGNSRHIDVRYFFTKDRIDKGEMAVKYCPTYEMLADYYTKPLQGSLFKKLRNMIMGFNHISSLKSKYRQSSIIKERVENINKNVIINNVTIDSDEKKKKIKVDKIEGKENDPIYYSPHDVNISSVDDLKKKTMTNSISKQVSFIE